MNVCMYVHTYVRIYTNTHTQMHFLTLNIMLTKLLLVYLDFGYYFFVRNQVEMMPQFGRVPAFNSENEINPNSNQLNTPAENCIQNNNLLYVLICLFNFMM